MYLGIVHVRLVDERLASGSAIRAPTSDGALLVRVGAALVRHPALVNKVMLNGMENRSTGV